MESLKGLILSGGAGTRLRPITHTSAKQLVPVANKPVLFYGIEALVDAGVTEIGIVIAPETGDAIRAAVGDGSALGANVTYIPQAEPLGLAHAVLTAEEFLGDAPFVMYLGDNLLRDGITGLVEAFRRNEPDALILLTQVLDPQHYGVAELDGERIVSLVEKPADPPSDLALVGVYMFKPVIFDAARSIEPSARGELEITDTIQKLIDTGHTVEQHRVKGWWKDTGQLADMLDANRLVLEDIERRLDGRLLYDLRNDGVCGRRQVQEAERRLEAALEQERLTGLSHIINATGVVLHTNLGRAPLSESALEAIRRAARYCNLEYDTATGSRGRRGIRVESLLVQLTGAEESLVVNNCAAAALLILNVLARDGETIVSRGELVEIGGDFRIPDVMATSGTRMVEVGTTNRTSIDDYRRAITKDTRLLMRVHPSNYRIVGFASSPALRELAHLARETSLPLYEDAGSGQMKDLSAYGVTDEHSVAELVASGADVISFSGDKLLGSAQAGLIVGKADVVNRLRKHPLYRALRIDKLRLAALEASLESYQRAIETEELPVMQMLSLSREDVRSRAKRVFDEISNQDSRLTVALLESDSSLWDQVRALPARQREAVALRYVADLDHAGVAAAMGTTPAATRRLVSDALAALRSEVDR